MCCRSRCYAPIKRVVPLLHSIITPIMTPSLTSDIADASDNMRDGNQQPFSQVNHSLYMCCRSFRRYAPIKKGVPLFHSITTPIKMPSQQGRSTSIHSTGKDCMVGKCSAARWGAERPAKSGVPENNIPGPRRTPPGFRTADDAANPSDPFGPQWV